MLIVRAQRDLTTNISHGDVAVTCRVRPIDCIRKHYIWLARFKSRFEYFKPALPGFDISFNNCFHERIADNNAMIEVEALAINVTTRSPNPNKLINVIMINAQVDASTPATSA